MQDLIKSPRGFLVMDTCCFIDYLDGNNHVFDYEGIKSFIKDNEYWLVITPYTLYEIIQKLNKVIQIRKRRNDFLAVGDFWVVNMNRVLEYDGFVYGLDFLFSLHLTNDEDLLKFDEERSRLREKVYHSLFNKMFFYAQLVAICCVVFEECDEQGFLPLEAIFQIKKIDDFFDEGSDNLERNFDRFFAQSDGKDYIGKDGAFYRGHDAKELLSEQLWDLIIQILSKTSVQREIFTKREDVDDNEYNSRIVKQYYHFMRDKYKDYKHSLHRLLTDCKNRTKGKIGIDNIIQIAFNKNSYDITMMAFKLLLEKQFSNNGVGKKFCNHFVDMTNVAMVETLNHRNVIVLTGDKVWQSILLNTDYKAQQLNMSFYEKYMRK